MKKIALSAVVISSTLITNYAYAGKINTSTLWTGFYGGINAGYTFPGSKNINVNPYFIQGDTNNGDNGPTVAQISIASGTGSFSLKNNGFIGGGQVGYNTNIHNYFIVGVETDIQGIADVIRSNSSTASVVIPGLLPGFSNNIVTGLSASKSIDYLGTLRGRLGYLFIPSLLISGTGGLVYGGVNSRTIIDQSITGTDTPGIERSWGTTGSYSNTRVGWTAGWLFEWMFSTNWSAKLEYLYYDLGTVTYSSGLLLDASTGAGYVPAGAPFFTNGVNTTTQFNRQLVRIGVNYHFA